MKNYFNFDRSLLERIVKTSEFAIWFTALYSFAFSIYYILNEAITLPPLHNLMYMKLETALSLVALSLASLSRPSFMDLAVVRRWLEKTLLIVVFSVAAYNILSWLAGISVLAESYLPPVNAACLILLSTKLYLRKSYGQDFAKFYQILSYISALIAFSAVLSFLIGLDSITGLSFYGGVRFAAAAHLLSLSLCLSLLDPKAGWLPILTAQNMGGRLLRRSLLFSLPFLIFSASLVNAGANHGFYGEKYALILFVVCAVAVLGLDLFAISLRLNTVDQQHKIALEALKLREKELQAAQELYADLYNEAPDMLLSVESKTGNIVSCNRTLTSRLGFTVEELIGTHISKMYTEEYANLVPQLMQEFKDNGRIQNKELVVIAKDGQHIDVSLNATAVRDSSGQVVMSRSIWRDISEIKKAREMMIREQAAAEGSRIKSKFVSTVSHEIRTPLNGVIGMSELLLLSPLNSVQKEYAETIHESAQSLLTLVNDILDFSKIESGKIEIVVEPFDMATLVDELKKQMTWFAKFKNLNIHFQFFGIDNMLYMGDKVRIRQIMINLISNAIKFTHRGHVSVLVTARHNSPDIAKVTFAVTDTGIGIAQDDMSRIFQAFTQSDATIAHNYGGTGLGLSISQSLTSLMGGEIKIVSELKKGSTFSFNLLMPLQGINQSIETRAEFVQKQFSRPPKILVAEDIDVNRKVIHAMLKQIGCDTDFAANGAEAIQKLESSDYDLVLMDCQMPVIDGFEATRQIRLHTDSRVAKTIIIALTAHATVEDREHCISIGMSDYISKPLTLTKLNQVLRRWVPDVDCDSTDIQETVRSEVSELDAVNEKLLSELAMLNGDMDTNFVSEVLALFNTRLPIRLLNIRNAINLQDSDSVIRQAHALKSSASVLGANTLAITCNQITSSAKQGNYEKASNYFDSLEADCQELVSFVNNWVTEHSTSL